MRLILNSRRKVIRMMRKRQERKTKSAHVLVAGVINLGKEKEKIWKTLKTMTEDTFLRDCRESYRKEF